MLGIDRDLPCTCIAIYLVEEHPAYHTQIETALRGGKLISSISPPVEMECLVLPIKKQRNDLITKFHEFFAAQRRLTMPDEVYRRAADLRARHNLKTPDALHLATAQLHGCTAFWTNDNRLHNAAGSLAVNIFTQRPEITT
jgi:predicted nucleic acid-binding protein